MFEPTLKMCMGLLLGTVSLYGLVANILVIVPVYRLTFVSKKSPIYLISLVNIFADIFNLLLTMLYLVPLILKNSYIKSSTTDIQISIIFGTCFMFCWYLGSITQIIMAVNRAVVICFKHHDFFTLRRLMLIFLCVFPMVLGLMYLAQFGFPCCALIYDSKILSIRYLSSSESQSESDINFSNMFIDVPLNFSCSFVAFLCYTMIVIKICKSKHQAIAVGGGAVQIPNREYAYALQFCLITIFYTISWILFRLFPMILENRTIEMYSFVMIAVSLNNSANAYVYIFFNKEVRRCIWNSRFLIIPYGGISSAYNENAAFQMVSSANFPSISRMR